MQRRTGGLAVALAAIVFFSWPLAAVTASGVTVLTQSNSTTFPIIINKPGSYKLGSNLDVPADTNGIEIQAADVTLDLNGFTIKSTVTCTGQGSTLTCSENPPVLVASAVYALNKHNITIRNGTVKGFAGAGIWLGDGGRVEEISAFENSSVGIFVGSGVVINCIAGRNGEGISVSNGQIKGSTGNGNYGTGINASSGVVADSTANNNGFWGITGDGYSLISNSTALFNTPGDMVNVRSTGNNSCTNGLC